MDNKIWYSIYFILLFIIFSSFIHHYIGSVPVATEGEKVKSYIPNITELIITVVLSIIIPIAILYFIKIDRINEFLKPTKWKIIPSGIIIVLLLVFIYGQELSWFKGNYVLTHILTFNSVPVFSGIFEFMELFFPIIMYYVIVCIVNKLVIKEEKV